MRLLNQTQLCNSTFGIWDPTVAKERANARLPMVAARGLAAAVNNISLVFFLWWIRYFSSLMHHLVHDWDWVLLLSLSRKWRARPSKNSFSAPCVPTKSFKTGANEMCRDRIRFRGLKVKGLSKSIYLRLKFLKASTLNSVPAHFICACLICPMYAERSVISYVIGKVWLLQYSTERYLCTIESNVERLCTERYENKYRRHVEGLVCFICSLLTL